MDFDDVSTSADENIADGTVVTNSGPSDVEVSSDGDNQTSNAPTAVDDELTINENTTVILNVLGNDTDPDGDSLSIESVTRPSNGSITINSNNTLTYTPATDFNGVDSLSYEISDGNGGTDEATITINVQSDDPAPNTPPVAVDDQFIIGTGAEVTLDVLNNDTDADEDNLTISNVTEPINGNVIINSDNNTLTYTPNPGFTGNEVLTYQVSDGNDGVDTALVTITVDDDVDTSPTVGDVTLNVDENTDNGTVVGAVTVTNPNPDATITFTVDPTNNGGGAFAVDASTGEITVANSALLDHEAQESLSFTVQVTDDSDEPLDLTADVTANIADINEAPIINSQSFVLPDAPDVTPLIGTVLAEDPDNGQTLTYAITAGNASLFGIDDSGQLTVLEPGQLTEDSYELTVTVTDNGAEPLSSSAQITVQAGDQPPDNTAPVATDDDFILREDTPFNLNVLNNDTDADEDTLIISNVSQPNNGSIDLNVTDNTLRYTPNANFTGTDSFTYAISDGNGGTDSATVTITVDDVNDPPLVDDLTFSIDENSANGTAVGTVEVTNPDPDEAFTFAIDPENNGGGAFAIDASTGEITVADVTLLNHETQSNIAFTVQVTEDNDDEIPLSTEAEITIGILDVNEAPIINDQTFSIPADPVTNPFVGTVTASDPDNNQSLSYEIIAGDSSLFAINDSGQLTILNPGAVVDESYQLTVTVTDDGTEPLSSTAQITINQFVDEDQLPDGVEIDFTGIEFGIVGTDQDDILTGTEGDDTLFGGFGNDQILAGSGNDIVSGGRNRDVISGNQGDDIIRGGRGFDEIGGGQGNDRLDGGDGEDLVDGRVGNDTILGGVGNDTLIGGEGADVIYGEEGDDTLFGNQDNDTLVGGAGNDQIFAGQGTDALSGGSGDDLLEGRAGDDTLLGGTGNDILIGGEGQDTLIGVENIQLGRGEQDILTGGAEATPQRDIFSLGDIGGVFYNDGDTSSDGRDDWALITDFDANVDSIQLSGAGTDYRLEDISVGDVTGAGIFWEGDGSQTGELIGVLQSVEASTLDLENSAQFTFVPSA